MKPPKKHPTKSKKNSPAMTDIEIDGEFVVSTGVPTPGGLTEYYHHFIKQNDKAHSEDYAASEAIRTLSKARIAYDPKEEGAYRYRIVDHVESLGYKPFDSAVWYAGAIIQFRIFVNDAIAENNAKRAAWFGFHLGQYYAEGRLKDGWEPDALSGRRSRDGAVKGGKQEKRLPPVATLVRSLIQRNRNATAKELWEMIPTDLWYGIRINGHKFYRNGGRLLALRKVDGYKDWRPAGKSLKFPAFQKRVTKARNLLTR